MAVEQKSPSSLVAHRRRLQARGLQRLEVQVRCEDAPLIRGIVAALNDPIRGEATRSHLLTPPAPRPARSFKALLESAPLDGIDLERSRDTGRDIEL